MTQDIIAMAREAGFQSAEFWPDDFKGLMGCVERFAALVRDAERNKLASWMMAQGYATGHGDTTEDLLKELEWQVRESERKWVLDYMQTHGISNESLDKAIRART